MKPDNSISNKSTFLRYRLSHGCFLGSPVRSGNSLRASLCWKFPLEPERRARPGSEPGWKVESESGDWETEESLSCVPAPRGQLWARLKLNITSPGWPQTGVMRPDCQDSGLWGRMKLSIQAQAYMQTMASHINAHIFILFYFRLPFGPPTYTTNLIL